MNSPFTAPLSQLEPSAGESIPELVSIGHIKVRPQEKNPIVPLLLPVGGAFEGSPGLCITKAGGYAGAADLQQALILRMTLGMKEDLLRIHAVDLLGMGACYPWLGALPRSVFSKDHLITDARALTLLLQQLLEDAKGRNLEKLAHRYSSIKEYNDSTGSHEPLHILVCSSYPALWTEEHITMLRQIIMLAPRVGIWVLVHHDPTQRTSGYKEVPEMAQDSISSLTQLTVAEDGITQLSNCPVPATLHPDWTMIPDGIATSLPTDHLDSVLTRMKETAEEPESQYGGIRVPIGTQAGQPFHFVLGHQSGAYHALIGGTTGSGKSVLLHNIILGLIQGYSTDEIQLVLMDLKEGVEFSVYQKHPMVRHFLHGTDAGEALHALEELQATLTKRGELFRETGVNDIARYNEKKPDALLPRIVVVIDEFQKLFTGGFRELGAVNALLEDLAKRGRSFGVHLIMGSQSLERSGFDKTTRNVFGLRIVLKIAASECVHFLEDIRNEAPSRFTRPGQAIYNARNGQKEANLEIQISYLSINDIQKKINYS